MLAIVFPPGTIEYVYPTETYPLLGAGAADALHVDADEDSQGTKQCGVKASPMCLASAATRRAVISMSSPVATSKGECM